RIRKMKRLVDLMLVILPFEEQLYQEAGVPVHFVGHPLLDQIPDQLLQETVRQTNLIGLLPGSREGEVRRILPVMRDAALLLRKSLPAIELFLPLSPNVPRSLVEEILGNIEVNIVPSPAYELRHQAGFALTASGTATLENALLGLPMAIIYKLMPLTYLIGRLLVQVDRIGLVNIVAQEDVVPEFIQSRARPEDISRYVLEYLQNPSHQKTVLGALQKVQKSLGEPGASERAAGLVLGKE
ncbi:MAG TPA: lipid-A-disaccharide synthase, partial [bacterium]|nr:lipid-A-disaccharide synthase [bacterium]